MRHIFIMQGISLISQGLMPYDDHYLKALFSDNYAVSSELPADFSVATYTIENGELVRAPAEIIASREAAALVASREAIRTEREQRYEAEPIKSLYWNWIESGLESDRALWIAAKNAVRAELPYPEEPTAV